jgi:hypothetical protein
MEEKSSDYVCYIIDKSIESAKTKNINEIEIVKLDKGLYCLQDKYGNQVKFNTEEAKKIRNQINYFLKDYK